LNQPAFSAKNASSMEERMKQIEEFGILIAVVLLTGCATTPIRTEVISEPPGAKIAVDGQYLGTAPVTLTLPQSANNHRLRKSVTIVAMPLVPGQRLQQKVLWQNMEAPHDVVFEMGQAPPPPPPAPHEVVTPPVAVPPEAPPPPAEPPPPPPPEPPAASPPES
jgi:hypothetical protein